MAARKVTINHHAQARERIKTSQLVNRLCGYALRQTDPQTGKPIEMTPNQVTAALGLLRKTLPDLSQVTGTLNLENKPSEMSDRELSDVIENFARRGSNGTVAPTNGTSKPH